MVAGKTVKYCEALRRLSLLPWREGIAELRRTGPACLWSPGTGHWIVPKVAAPMDRP